MEELKSIEEVKVELKARCDLWKKRVKNHNKRRKQLVNEKKQLIKEIEELEQRNETKSNTNT